MPSSSIYITTAWHPPRHSSYISIVGRLRTQLVTARDDVLTIYDVYERSTSSTFSAAASTSTASNSRAQNRHKLVIARRHNLFGTITVCSEYRH